MLKRQRHESSTGRVSDISISEQEIIDQIDISLTYVLTKNLHGAAYAGYITLTKILLDNGADKNTTEVNQQRTPMHVAAECGHLEIVKLLLEEGANFDAIDTNHLSPYAIAQENGRQDIQDLINSAWLADKMCMFSNDANFQTYVNLLKNPQKSSTPRKFNAKHFS